MVSALQHEQFNTASDSKVSVLIVEDHDLVRLSVKLSLESSGQIEVIGEAANGADGVRLARNSDAQVVIMDIGLPELNGIDATRLIKEETDKKVIVLTSHADEKSIISALKAGADGFVLKDTKTEDLLLALYSVAHGASWLEDSIARKVASQLYPRFIRPANNLSDQELRMMTMVKSGMSLNGVSQELCLPLSIIHDQVTAVLRRTAKSIEQEAAATEPRAVTEAHNIPCEPAMICCHCRSRVEGHKVCPEDGCQLIADPLIGTLLAERYQIISMLGTGGNGTVYKAQHCFTTKTVAVKVLHKDLSQNTDLINRFRQEAIAISSFDHANLVSVYDFGMTPDGFTYMVMDYLEGKSLINLIRDEGPLSYRKAVPIFEEICEGVAHAHEAGIIHRDLKPGNVHVLSATVKGGLVKVLDFGLAKMRGENNIVMTVPGEIFGSPAFMSPEQCRGQKLDIRSDVYSMGCLMYQTLTGETPFSAQSAPEVMYHQIYSQPAPFEEVASNLIIPRLLETVVMKCLEKNPVHRFQSMGELKRALNMCAV